MIVDDALQRIDSVLNLKPLEENQTPNAPAKCFRGTEIGSFQL